MKHVKRLDNYHSPFPRHSSSGLLVAQHHLNSEFVQGLVVLASLIPSFGHLQKDVKGPLLVPLSWADPEGIVPPDPCWHKAHNDEFF